MVKISVLIPTRLGPLGYGQLWPDDNEIANYFYFLIAYNIVIILAKF